MSLSLSLSLCGARCVRVGVSCTRFLRAFFSHKSKHLGFRVYIYRLSVCARYQTRRQRKTTRTYAYGTIDQPARVLPLAVRRSRGRGDRESRQRSAVAQEQRARGFVRGAERCESGYVTRAPIFFFSSSLKEFVQSFFCFMRVSLSLSLSPQSAF